MGQAEARTFAKMERPPASLGGEGSLAFFEGFELGQPPRVPRLTVEPGVEKGLHQILGEFAPDHTRTEGEDIGIVVLDGLAGRKGVVTHTGPGSLELFCGGRRPPPPPPGPPT